MPRKRVTAQIQNASAGSADTSADPFFHPIGVVLDELVCAERKLNPAIAKFLELRGKVETMSIEELALLRPELAQAIEDGQAEQEQVKQVVERLARALPEPAVAVPRGF
jgi:hypothetical protein